MSEMELIERASAKDEIRQALAELERQKPKNKEAFESREAEIRRLLDLFALTCAPEAMSRRREVRCKIGLILLLMLSAVPFGVGAYAEYDLYRQTTVDWMRENHDELATLNDTLWVINMSETQSQGKWEYRLINVNGSCEQYELIWTGRVRQKDNWGKVSVNEYSYTFRLITPPEDPPEPPPEDPPEPPPEDPPEPPPEDPPEPPPEDPPEPEEPEPEEPQRKYVASCSVLHEDGLLQGYMWRDDHVLLVIHPNGKSAVTVTVVSDYRTYNRTVTTRVKSLCIYFSALRFVGDYELTVTANNGVPYTPRYLLAGLDRYFYLRCPAIWAHLKP